MNKADEKGQLSERTQKRLEQMIACGVARETAELTAEVMRGIGADSMDWSIFADLEADPPTLQLSNSKTGAHIECSNLGGPNNPVSHGPEREARRDVVL